MKQSVIIYGEYYKVVDGINYNLTNYLIRNFMSKRVHQEIKLLKIYTG